MDKQYLITTPIPYTNASPHMGHLLEGVYNDTIARYLRRTHDGNVNLTMGLDQHGLKIYQAATKANQPIGEFVTEQGQTFVDLWQQFSVHYDSWIPTTTREHKVVAQMFWKKLASSGHIYKKSYKGLYNMYDEVFVLEKDLDTNGDLPGRPGVKPIEMEEENYFFRLTAFRDTLIDYLNRCDIRPAGVRQEMINFIQDDLQDVSFSRDKSKLPWGIPVPGDDTQVIYVWCDALVNYATGCINLETIDRWYELPVERDAIEEELWAEIREAFPIDLMYVGKDITRFHLLYWPAMLIGCGVEPPTRCIVHGHINAADGRKMSKSLGNGVVPQELVDKFGVDGTRFLILHDINLYGDTSFDWEVMRESYNSHLANNLGNLLMRVTTLIEKNFDGLIELDDAEVLFDSDIVFQKLDSLDTREALEELLKAGRLGNEALEQTKPWTLIKEGKTEEARKILTNLAGLLNQIGDVLSIFLPDTGARIREVIQEIPMKKAEVLFVKIEPEA
jgi:methionyl-tRNA synthetase